MMGCVLLLASGLRYPDGAEEEGGIPFRNYL